MNNARTGSSLVQTVNDAPTSLLVTLGFTSEQAARMIAVRRVLPLMDDTETPCIDARKLWERIGKPEGRFNDWMARGAAELLREFAQKNQVHEVLTPTKGRPRIDYLLSRDCAMHLAMLARTDAGHAVRSYFLDMERLAVRLSAYMPIRTDMIVGTDRGITHITLKLAAAQHKAGDISKEQVYTVANQMEQKMKRAVCQVLTGHPTSKWRDTFGKGIRDVLIPADLAMYANAYESARVIVGTGLVKSVDALKVALTKAYGSKKISLSKYMALFPLMIQPEKVAAIGLGLGVVADF